MAALITQPLLQGIKNYLEQQANRGDSVARQVWGELGRQESQTIRVWLKYYFSEPGQVLSGVYSSLELALASEPGEWTEGEYFYSQESPYDLYEGISIRKAGEVVITE